MHIHPGWEQLAAAHTGGKAGLAGQLLQAAGLRVLGLKGCLVSDATYLVLSGHWKDAADAASGLKDIGYTCTSADFVIQWDFFHNS